MSLLTALFTLPLWWLGLESPVLALQRFGEPDKVQIESPESLIFVGISGDYSGDIELTLRDRLAEEFGLSVVGSPVRSVTAKDQRVWALRTVEDFKSLRKKMLRPMKKAGYELVEMRVTAFTVIGQVPVPTLRNQLRELERAEKYLWGTYESYGEGVVWAFHEPKLRAAKLLDEMREADIKLAFWHQEVELEPGQKGVDLAQLLIAAQETLDLCASTGKETSLLLDFYVRDVESMMALDRGRHTVACPELRPLINGSGQAGWAVTLENRGYPFLD